jgi:hypothetical protein
MASSPEDDPKQACQARQAQPKIENREKWDPCELITWIEREEPRLLNKLEVFKKRDISGRVFLNHAGDPDFFGKKCDMSVRQSDMLAQLAAKLAGGETAGMKSKYHLSYHLHHVDTKLTTSQETDSRPEMRRCPLLPESHV